MKNVVYTVITARKDDLRSVQPSPGWDYVCFTDDLSRPSGHWQLRHLPDVESNPRRNSRLPKLAPHRYLSDYAYSIYVDGHIELLAPPNDLVTCLGKNEIALFKHPWRECIYDEAEIVIENGLESEVVVRNQVEKYRKEGYPETNGLINGQVIVRKHSADVANFNELWWDVYATNSQRDQLAFNYCAWASGISYSTIPGCTYMPNAFVRKHSHAYPAEMNWKFVTSIIKSPKKLRSVYLYLMMSNRKAAPRKATGTEVQTGVR